MRRPARAGAPPRRFADKRQTVKGPGRFMPPGGAKQVAQPVGVVVIADECREAGRRAGPSSESSSSHADTAP
ncbi:hypothetical protein ACTG9Q_24650 [Actinokineospora sp. 24-640]